MRTAGPFSSYPDEHVKVTCNRDLETWPFATFGMYGHDISRGNLREIVRLSCAI